MEPTKNRTLMKINIYIPPFACLRPAWYAFGSGFFTVLVITPSSTTLVRILSLVSMIGWFIAAWSGIGHLVREARQEVRDELRNAISDFHRWSNEQLEAAVEEHKEDKPA